MKKILFINILIVTLTLNLFSNDLYFLKDAGVKNTGALKSLAVFADDAFTPFINPAGLSILKKQEIAFTYIDFYGLSNLSAGSFAYPIFEKGSFAISGIISSVGEIEERNDINEVTGKFNDTYKVLNISYGIKIIDFLDAGISLKYIYHNFYNIAVSTYGLDGGLNLYLPYDIKISTILFNMVKPVFEYSSFAKDILPVEFNLLAGKKFKIFDNQELKISIGADFKEFENKINLGAAVEYSIFANYFIRAGITEQDFTAGLSIKISDMTLDYAFVKMPLDFNHRFSISISYGENIRQLEESTKTKEAKIKQELITKIKTETINKYRLDIENYIKNMDLENAKITVEKALAWAPDENWFKEKEEQINKLMNQKKIRDLILEADDFIKQDLYIDAMVRLKSVLDIEPENKIAKEKFKLAENYVKTLGEKNIIEENKNTEKIKIHFEKGLKYYSEQNYKEAIKEWDMVIKSSPLQRQVYNYIKSAEEKIKKKEEQKKTVELLKKQKITELYNKAVLEYTKGNFNESLNIWHELLKVDPENKEAKEYIEKIVEDYKKIQKQEIGW